MGSILCKFNAHYATDPQTLVRYEFPPIYYPSQPALFLLVPFPSNIITKTPWYDFLVSKTATNLKKYLEVFINE